MRNLGILLHKELLASRRGAVALLFVLVLLPAAVAGGSVLFQEVIPRDAPVAVVGEDASDRDRQFVTAAVGTVGHPVEYDDRDEAYRALDRERVYAVVEVPPGIATAGAGEEVTVRYTVDGSVVPYHEPSQAAASVLQRSLDEFVDADVTVEHTTQGSEWRLPEYLLPTFLFAVAYVFAFAYLPYRLVGERSAMDRLRVETSLSAVVAAKVLYTMALFVVPLAVFQAVGVAFDYGVWLLRPTVVATYLLSFLLCGVVATAVTFASGLGTTGRLANLLLLFGVLGLSGLAYPAGFFSAAHREVVHLMPTHYAAVAVRGVALRGLDAAAFGDWLAGLAGLTLLACVPLWLSMRLYERRDLE